MVARRGASNRDDVRGDVAARYLRGEGIEIGALDIPLRMPRGASVRYVDYLDEAQLRATYSVNLRHGRPLVTPDVIDDGTRLASFPDASLEADWPTLSVLSRRYIDKALQHTNGNKTRAADLLGIDRRTLNRILARDRARRSAKPE